MTKSFQPPLSLSLFTLLLVTMASRLQQVANHLTGLVSPGPVTGPAKVGVKSPNDVVVVSALRTPIARGRKGGFKDTTYEGSFMVSL